MSFVYAESNGISLNRRVFEDYHYDVCSRLLTIRDILEAYVKQAKIAENEIRVALYLAERGYDAVTQMRLRSMLDWHCSNIDLLLKRRASLARVSLASMEVAMAHFAHTQAQFPRSLQSSIFRIMHIWGHLKVSTVPQTLLYQVSTLKAHEYLHVVHKFYVIQLTPIKWLSTHASYNFTNFIDSRTSHTVIPSYPAHTRDYKPPLEELSNLEAYPRKYISHEAVEFPIPVIAL